MTKWQPIETAPKDENPVLVWEDGQVSIAVCGSGRYWHGMIGGKLMAEADEMLTYLAPTYWMPLPPPPQEAQ